MDTHVRRIYCVLIRIDTIGVQYHLLSRIMQPRSAFGGIMITNRSRCFEHCSKVLYEHLSGFRACQICRSCQVNILVQLYLISRIATHESLLTRRPRVSPRLLEDCEMFRTTNPHYYWPQFPLWTPQGAQFAEFSEVQEYFQAHPDRQPYGFSRDRWSSRIHLLPRRHRSRILVFWKIPHSPIEGTQVILLSSLSWDRAINIQ